MSDSLWPHGLYLSMEFSRPEYWSGSCPPPWDLPNPGIKPRSAALQADSLPAEPPGKPKNTGVGSLSLLKRIFLTQESNRGLLNCRQVLYQLSYQGNGKPPQYSCLENSMDRGAWWATVHGVARVRHNLPTKPPTHCFLLIISTLQMRKLRLRLNNFPKSQQVTEWLSIVFDFQRQNSIHCSILTGRWGEKQINTHSLNIGLFAFRWDNKKRS